MDELRAKGWRVAGMFVLMMGGGLLLESSAVRTGAALLLVGAGAFLWGALGLRAPARRER